MEQTTKTRAYHWQNRLSDMDRQMIAVLYLEGFAVYNIARNFNVSPSSVEWHLTQMDVYQKNRKPTKWNTRLIAYKRVTYKKLALPESNVKKLPAHIQAIYDNMEKEDDSAINRPYHIKSAKHKPEYLVTTPQEILKMKPLSEPRILFEL